MVLTSENSVAENGTPVQSTVRLFIERIGVGAKPLPFRVQVHVGNYCLTTSHHATEAAAKIEREKMHAAYLEVHSKAA